MATKGTPPPPTIRVLNPELLASALQVETEHLVAEIERHVTATALVNAARTIGCPLSDLVASI